jgi:transposase InsO family protein
VRRLLRPAENRTLLPSGLETATVEQFVKEVGSYIRWYNEKRIKIFLGSFSPIEYRESLGLTA